MTRTVAERRIVNLFISYAQADEPLAGLLVDELKPYMAASKKYKLRLWRDTALLLGELWDQEIHDAMAGCDAGLLLVSPKFLGSDYIREVELPVFVGATAKPVMPVAIKIIDFDRLDLLGLEAHQVYRWKSPRCQRLAYSECQGVAREKFLADLFGQIERRLDRITGGQTHA